MDNVPSSAIWLVVSFIATALVCGVCVSLYMSSNKLGNNVMREKSVSSAQIENSEFGKYDNETVKGSTIIRLIRLWGDKKIAIRVKSSATDTGILYIRNLNADNSLGSKKNLTKEIYERIQFDDTAADYIDSEASFTGKVIANNNGSITAIEFTKG